MGKPEKYLPSEAVVKRLDELRAEGKISYHRIALGSGVPYSTIKSYVQGAAKDITLGTLVSLANYFDMTVREFLDSEYFDMIDVARVRNHSGIVDKEDLEDLKELQNKSEEWLL